MKGFTLKLEVHERLALLNLLPTKSGYAGLKSIRKAKEIISFTPEEVEYYELVHDSGQTKWSSSKAVQRVLDAPMEEYIVDLVRQKLSEMERKQELTEQYISIYEKFVLAYLTVSP